MDDERFVEGGPSDIEAIKKGFEDRSVGPTYLGLALGLLPRPVLVCGVMPNADLPPLAEGLEDHRARWVFFKQSNVLDKEYATFGLEIEWHPPNEPENTKHSVVLMFPASEYMEFLQDLAVMRTLMLEPGNRDDPPSDKSVVLTDLPIDVLVPGLAALTSPQPEE